MICEGDLFGNIGLAKKFVWFFPYAATKTEMNFLANPIIYRVIYSMKRGVCHLELEKLSLKLALEIKSMIHKTKEVGGLLMFWCLFICPD